MYGQITPQQVYVVSHSEMGVFLGACMGFCFWSKLDAVGQTEAIGFTSEQEANDFIDQQIAEYPEYNRPDFIITPANLSPSGWVTMDEIERIGLPRWDPQDPKTNSWAELTDKAD